MVGVAGGYASLKFEIKQIVGILNKPGRIKWIDLNYSNITSNGSHLLL